MSRKSLYIHIPFCKSKCIYCDFLSFSGKEIYIEEYLNFLSLEMQFYKNQKISSIFIGGGTPSVLSIKQLQFLFEQIKSNFNTENLYEFTIEANPESLSYEKIFYLKNNGILNINRISLGLQSFDDNILKQIGRQYKYSEFEKKIEIVRDLDFEKLNIDLIIGWPFETYLNIDKKIEKLDKFLSRFNPEHISVYMLNVAEKTKLYDFINKKKINNIDDDFQIEEYLQVSKFLNSHNFFHYEISNFAKNFNNQCIHNLSYWQGSEYIGLGLNASGFIDGIRYRNPNTFSQYFKMIENKNNSKYKYEEILTEEQKFYEKIFLGLRLLKKGLDLEDIKKYTQINKLKGLSFDKFFFKIKEFEKQDYFYLNENKVFLTYKGILISNLLITELIDI